MRTFLIIVLIILLNGLEIKAQDSLENQHSLNFPLNKYGISIGNSHVFNGIRINFADKNVKTVNGINLTFWCCKENTQSVVNGINVGVIPTGGTSRFVNVGILGVGAHSKLCGLTLAGGVIGVSGYLTGLSGCGLITVANDITGLTISGLAILTRRANGILLGGLIVNSEDVINGFCFSIAYVNCNNKINGVCITSGYLKSTIFKGVSVSGYSNINQMKGLSIALINRTKELRGIQLGLLNYVENNPKWLRLFPLINIHL